MLYIMCDLGVPRRCLHFNTTRVHQTRSLVVSFLLKRPFGDRDAPRRLAVDCAFGKGRHAVRASGVLRFALRRGAMGQRKARPLWVDVARAPVDVTVAGLQTGVSLLSRMARSVTGSQTPEPKRTLLKSMKSFRSTLRGNQMSL